MVVLPSHENKSLHISRSYPPAHPPIVRATTLNNVGPLHTWEPLQHTAKGVSGESLAFMIKREQAFSLECRCVSNRACAAIL